MADDKPQNGSKKSAVYVSWVTFQNELARLAKAGLPNRLDKTVFPGQSWGVINQLLTGFRFLGFIDNEGTPLEPLKAIVSAEGDAKRDELLAKVIRERYAPLFALDLTKATPAQLDERISESFGGTAETREKAARFFLSALAHLKIPVSHLLSKQKPGGNGAQPRRRRRAAKPAAEPAPPPTPAQQDGTTKTVTLRSGAGTVSVSTTVDVMRLSKPDRDFVFRLIDQLTDYEAAEQQPQPQES